MVLSIIYLFVVAADILSHLFVEDGSAAASREDRPSSADSAQSVSRSVSGVTASYHAWVSDRCQRVIQYATRLQLSIFSSVQHSLHARNASKMS